MARQKDERREEPCRYCGEKLRGLVQAHEHEVACPQNPDNLPVEPEPMSIEEQIELERNVRSHLETAEAVKLRAEALRSTWQSTKATEHDENHEYHEHREDEEDEENEEYEEDEEAEEAEEAGGNDSPPQHFDVTDDRYWEGFDFDKVSVQLYTRIKMPEQETKLYETYRSRVENSTSVSSWYVGIIHAIDKDVRTEEVLPEYAQASKDFVDKIMVKEIALLFNEGQTQRPRRRDESTTTSELSTIWCFR